MQPIDKSNSQDRHNKNQQSKGKERESKTQSAKERREKAEKKYQTMSHAWLTIKHEISTYRLENQRKSVKRTMEQMKKLKLRSVKQGNDDTDMCTYGNHSDTADFNGDNTDDESTLIIDFVQISNSREDRIGDTESQTSYLEDDVFGVKKHEERSTVYQEQAGELIMREQLPPYQYNRAPFLVRRQTLDPILRDSSSNNKVRVLNYKYLNYLKIMVKHYIYTKLGMHWLTLCHFFDFLYSCTFLKDVLYIYILYIYKMIHLQGTQKTKKKRIFRKFEEREIFF